MDRTVLAGQRIGMGMPADETRVEPPGANAPTSVLPAEGQSMAGRALGHLGVTFRSLRHRNYLLYFSGQLISLTGSWMQTTALMWLANDLTGTSRWPAWIMAGSILPTFFLGAWGGGLADRFPKRSLLFVTQTALLLLAMALAILVMAGWAGPWQLLIISILSGLVQAVDLPARLAFVMDMVGREDLTNAVALNSLLFNVARAIGPAFAGWVLKLLGPGLCFLANSLSFVPLLWALLQMDLRHLKPAKVERHSGSLLNGFRFLADRPTLGILVLLVGAFSLFGWPFLALMPAYARDVMGVGEQGFSLMLSGTGFGALAAALAVASFASRARFRLFIETGTWIVTGGLVGLAFAAALAPATGFAGLVGFGLVLFFATSQAMVQLESKEHNRGLIMGIYAMVISGGAPLGQLVFGPAADRWGEPAVLLFQGLCCGLASLILFLLLRLWPRSQNTPT
jgi:MFS family permease